jgi:flagellar hook-associated protein FlgK
MTTMIDFSTPLAAMQRASSTVQNVASRVARVGDPAGDAVDLSAEMVALLVARQDFAMNTKVIQTFDAMTKSLLNTLG